MKDLQGLLEQSAYRYSTHLAIEHPERNEVLSYGELDRLAGIVGSLLKSAGVGAGDRVAICGEKSAAFVAAIFAVLKTSAAYVPLDPDSPAPRNADIVRDVAASALLADEQAARTLESVLGWTPAAVPEKIFTGWSVFVPPVHPKPGDLKTAYILYTSGSTGEPKGVVHTHESALAFVDWCSEVFRLEPSDRVLSVAPFHFDLSVFDLFVSVKHSARIVLAGRDARFHPQSLAILAAERRVTIWYSTPTTLRLFLRYGEPERADWSALRLVLFAGEVFDPADLEALRRVWKGSKYYNLYGPTETNVCTYFDATQHSGDEGPIPIGVACPFDRVRLAGDALPGHEGEILVSGASVMQGYWGRPKNTREAFWTDPRGLLWYRTGDFAKDRGDGQWVFEGRRDRRVKRRGYRVELGAIETVLRAHPFVAEAAVVALPDCESGVRIRAHVSWSSVQPKSLAGIRNFCAGRMPPYMIPDSFLFSGSLPKLSSGKIDYRRLE